MNVEKQCCPYCSKTQLRVQQRDLAEYYLQCDNCGASGPRNSSRESLSILPRFSDESLLRTVIDESPDIVCLKNWHGEFLLCNKALARLYDTTPEQMLGKSDAHFNPDTDQVDFYLQNIQAVIREGRVQIVEEPSTDSVTGEVRYFQSIKKPLKGPDGSDRILVIGHDVTELRRAYQLIEEKEKRYAYAMDAAGEGLWDWDIDENRVTHNAKWCQLLGLDDALAVHDMSVLERLIHPDDRDSMMAALTQALTGDGFYSHEHRMLSSRGDKIWVHDRGRVVECDHNGNPARMVGSITDITARKMFERRLAETSRNIEISNEQLERQVVERTSALARANQELEALTKRDVLTGIGNRLLLDDWRARQDANDAFVVMMLDVDHFKQVNDRYGHKVGDKVLQQIAQCLAVSVRRHDLVIRLGGEEFLVILTSVDLERAVSLAECLRVRVSDLEVLPAGGKVTASLGVAAGLCCDFDTVLGDADNAMYRAKRAGRNKVMVSPAPPSSRSFSQQSAF